MPFPGLHFCIHASNLQGVDPSEKVIFGRILGLFDLENVWLLLKMALLQTHLFSPTNGELSSYLKLPEGGWSRIDKNKQHPLLFQTATLTLNMSTRHLSICAALLPILHHAPGGKHEGAILQWMDGLTSSKPRHPLCPPKTNVNMFLPGKWKIPLNFP